MAGCCFTSHPVVTAAEVLWCWGPHRLEAAETGTHAASCQHERNREGKKVLNTWKWPEHPLQG